MWRGLTAKGFRAKLLPAGILLAVVGVPGLTAWALLFASSGHVAATEVMAPAPVTGAALLPMPTPQPTATAVRVWGGGAPPNAMTPTPAYPTVQLPPNYGVLLPEYPVVEELLDILRSLMPPIHQSTGDYPRVALDCAMTAPKPTYPTVILVPLAAPAPDLRWSTPVPATPAPTPTPTPPPTATPAPLLAPGPTTPLLTGPVLSLSKEEGPGVSSRPATCL